MFPFASEIEVNAKLTLPCGEIHRVIGPLLTVDRKEKIDTVASERNFNNVVVLENIYDRGNCSAVMRSAEALGFAQLHLIEIGEKFKESQRTTAGADKWLEVKKWKSSRACIDQIKSEGKKLIVTHLDTTSVPLSSVDFSGPTALVLGNEKDGVSEEMIQAADVRVAVPMTGFVQSYNISVAAALCFYHIFLDREKRLGKNNSLQPEEVKILQAVYYLRSLDSAEDILRKVKK